MAAENRLWGQKRIQAELARLGFQVSARTVAKYMRVCRSRGPTGTWRGRSAGWRGYNQSSGRASGTAIPVPPGTDSRLVLAGHQSDPDGRCHGPQGPPRLTLQISHTLEG